MKMSVRKVCEIGVLTALYAALSAMIKIPLYGHIQLDLGYIALAVACAVVGPWAGFVGAVGCGIESVLFSPLGFSIGWFVANLIIGATCGYVFKKYDNLIVRFVAMIVAVAIGLLIAKTAIECCLYGIPFQVKIVKSFVAFIADVISMGIGLLIAPRIVKLLNR